MTAFVGFPQDSHAFSADEVGRALAGLVRRESDGSPRVGMLAVGPAVTAVAASWKAQVGVFTYVHQVSGAVQFSGLSAAEQVDITPATTIPVGQGRIDLIVWDPVEAELAVVEGSPSSSPAVPSAPGFASVATVRVNSGDGMVLQGQIADVFQVTGLVGEARKAFGTVAKRAIIPGSTTEITVPFPVGLFTEPPNVQVTTWGIIRDVNAGVDTVTKDQVVISLGSNSAGTRTFGAFWRAEQA